MYFLTFDSHWNFAPPFYQDKNLSYHIVYCYFCSVLFRNIRCRGGLDIIFCLYRIYWRRFKTNLFASSSLFYLRQILVYRNDSIKLLPWIGPSSSKSPFQSVSLQRSSTHGEVIEFKFLAQDQRGIFNFNLISTVTFLMCCSVWFWFILS